MSRAFLLGAGASYSYTQSPLNVRPPLATRLFETYFKLPIAEDPHVIIGHLVNYVRDTRGITPDSFGQFTENAEDFLTELDDRVNELAQQIPEIDQRKDARSAHRFAEFIQISGAYDQSVWLFTHILNSIQNGPVSKQYSDLVASLGDDDKLITFNWDTLLDRALLESGKWIPDTGYGFEFEAVHDEQWRTVRADESSRIVLKLHGSTNWLVNYTTRDLRTGERAIMVPSVGRGTTGMSVSVQPQRQIGVTGDLTVTYRPDIRTHSPVKAAPVPSGESARLTPFCFVSGTTRFHCYKGRFRDGYEKFSYFYPPNHPQHREIALMPLIIPPTRRKLYSEFGYIFARLWSAAEDSLANADEWVIAGYSFPKTDVRSTELIRSAINRRKNPPKITLVNPAAGEVKDRLAASFNGEDLVFTRAYSDFDQYLESLKQ